MCESLCVCVCEREYVCIFFWGSEPSKAASFQLLWSRCLSLMNIHEGFRTQMARTWDINIINLLSVCPPLSLHSSSPSPLVQLPWKSLTSIIEYYYMWKTTDRYVQQVRLIQNFQNHKNAICMPPATVWKTFSFRVQGWKLPCGVFL